MEISSALKKQCFDVCFLDGFNGNVLLLDKAKGFASSARADFYLFLKETCEIQKTVYVK